jgi:hypothetical protein
MMSDRKIRMLLRVLLEDHPERMVTSYLLDAYVSCYCVIGTIYTFMEYRDGALSATCRSRLGQPLFNLPHLQPVAMSLRTYR